MFSEYFLTCECSLKHIKRIKLEKHAFHDSSTLKCAESDVYAEGTACVEALYKYEIDFYSLYNSGFITITNII